MRSIVNPEGLRRDNDLQLPAVLFSILDKSKGRNEGKEGGVGRRGEERRGKHKWEQNGVDSHRSCEEGWRDKETRQRKDVIILFIVSR